LALDLGLTSKAFAEDTSGGRPSFGAMEPLGALMQETEADKLLPIVVSKLQGGTDLRTIVGAAALANARAFGGHDYDGYHTFMALAPSFQMAQEVAENLRALPVLKVLHRNARFIHKIGCHEHDTMHGVESGNLPAGNGDGPVLREATRQ